MGGYLTSAIGWVIAFAVTAVLGGWVAEAYQRRNWLFQQRITSERERYEQNINLVDRLLVVVNLRIDASKSYIEILRGLDPELIIEERGRYRTVVDRWTSEAPAMVSSIQKNVSVTEGNKFNDYFFAEFRSVDQHLGKFRKGTEAGDMGLGHHLRAAQGILYLIEFRAKDFQYEVENILAEARIKIEQKPKISIENRRILSYSYLLKSLFEPRSNA